MKNRGISNMNTACSAERRAFLKVLTTTTVALVIGGCGGAATPDPASSAPGANPPPGSPPGANLAPAWQTVPNVTFAQGVPSSVSIDAYVRDANGDGLVIAMNSATLPAGVTYDAVSKRFVYDGIGDIGSTSGVVLTADDGQS